MVAYNHFALLYTPLYATQRLCQIAALSDRTTLADGNTWNTEHIGLVGLMLSAPVDESWLLARHLADYVLVGDWCV